jgi:hypothetical protein
MTLRCIDPKVSHPAPVTKVCILHFDSYICRLKQKKGVNVQGSYAFAKTNELITVTMKALKTLIFILITVTFHHVLMAQQTVLAGDVNIIQDDRVNTLIDKHIQSNTAFNGMTGYRIQIFFDSGSNAKNRANNERRRFMTLFPQTKAFVTFDAPNFKVRVGNFRTRLEAEKWLREIQKHFDMAYVVPSRIELPNL